MINLLTLNFSIFSRLNMEIVIRLERWPGLGAIVACSPGIPLSVYLDILFLAVTLEVYGK